MNRNISVWQGGVLDQEEPVGLGLASDLFEASITAFAALLRVLLEDLGHPEVDSDSYDVLRNEFQRFYMWNDGFSTRLGELDRILLCSKNLRAAVLNLMVRWAKTVCRIPRVLSGYDFSKVSPVIIELEAIAEKVDQVAETAANDVKIQYAMKSLDDLSRSDSDSDSSSLMSDENFEDIVEDLKVYNEGLLDLTPSLEYPANDFAAVEDSNIALDLSSVTEPARPFVLILKDRFPSTAANLIKKLGEANWHRRERLREKLESAPVVAYLSFNDNESSSVGGTVVDHREHQAFGSRSLRTSVIESSMSRTSIYQTNTTVSDFSSSSIFDQDAVQSSVVRRGRSTVQSVTSFATSIADWPENGQRRVPNLPPDHDFESSFRCVICGDLQKDIQNPADWKKHVYSDLEPYICLFTDCTLGLYTFQSRREWMIHEFQTHRIDTNWRCSVCAETFSTAVLLREHIGNMHMESFKLSQIEEIIAASKQLLTRHNVRELCPFCQTIPSETQRGFASHVGRHLQEISLAALPALDLYSENDSEDGSIEEEYDDDHDDNVAGSKGEKPTYQDQNFQSLADIVRPTESMSANTSGFEQSLKDDARDANNGLSIDESIVTPTLPPSELLKASDQQILLVESSGSHSEEHSVTELYGKAMTRCTKLLTGLKYSIKNTPSNVISIQVDLLKVLKDISQELSIMVQQPNPFPDLSPKLESQESNVPMPRKKLVHRASRLIQLERILAEVDSTTSYTQDSTPTPSIGQPLDQEALRSYRTELQRIFEELLLDRVGFESEESLKSKSLYYACMNLRQRLARVPKFTEYLNGSDKYEEADAENPLSLLWECFRKGDPLITIYNAVQPPVPIFINDRTIPERTRPKYATYKFIEAFLSHPDFRSKSCFMLNDLFGNDVTGFVKVIAAVNTVLDEAESRGLLLTHGEGATVPLTIDQTGQKSHRDHVVSELVDTERRYVHDLKSLNELKVVIQQREILAKDIIYGIFLNIGPILDFQQRFLIALEETLRKPKATQNWGLPFINFEDAFDLYQPFLVNQRKAAELAKKEFEKIAIINHPFVVDFNTLDGILLNPMSRLVKYHLILQDLYDNCDNCDNDEWIKLDLAAGFESVKRIIQGVDAAIDREEKADAVAKLSSQVEDWKGHSVKQFGELLLHGQFMILRGDGDVEKEYKTYVFERILIACKEINSNKTTKSSLFFRQKFEGDRAKKSKSTTLQLRGRIFLQNITDIVTLAKNGSYTLQIWWKQDPSVENFTIRFRNEEIAKKWSSTIDKQKRILAAKPTIEPLHDSAPQEFPWMKTHVNPNPYAQSSDDSDDDSSQAKARQLNWPLTGDSGVEKMPLLGRTSAETEILSIPTPDDNIKSLVDFSGLLTPQEGGMDAPGQVKVRIKCDESSVTLVALSSISYSTLIERIDVKITRFSNSSIGQGNLRLQYQDEDGDFVTILSDEDVRIAFEDQLASQRRDSQVRGLKTIELFCTSRR